jgi:DNA polymerase-3 subunit gamma/tau
MQVQGGTALDLIEIDAASNRGIDEIRDLRERVSLAPALGRFKVYIIDEAHMLTTEAFNALLKTLEEPPDHVVFILCTTEVNKVPLTVLGRCQHFVFRRLSAEQIVRRLAHIAERESIAADADALTLIARVAQGSMRDAVGQLDQLVPLTEGRITVTAARELLGIADPARLDSLLDLVLGGHPGRALEGLGTIYEDGGELRQVVRGLMERCRDRLVLAIESRDDAARRRLSGVLDALLHLDGEVRRHAEPRFLVEATLVRLSVEGSASASPVAAAAPPPAPPPAIAAAVPPPVTPVVAPPEQVAPPASVAPDPLEGWRGVLDAMAPKTRAYFREARPRLAQDLLVLTFPYGFHHRMASESMSEVEPLIRTWLGGSAKLELRLRDAEPAVPEAGAPARPATPEEDPVVRAAERRLEGRVVRVRRLKEPQ